MNNGQQEEGADEEYDNYKGRFNTEQIGDAHSTDSNEIFNYQYSNDGDES